MKYLNEEKLNMAKDMDELPCALVFSQEIVKNYVEHLKYLKFSKDLGDNTTAEKRRNNEGGKKKNMTITIGTSWYLVGVEFSLCF